MPCLLYTSALGNGDLFALIEQMLQDPAGIRFIIDRNIHSDLLIRFLHLHELRPDIFIKLRFEQRRQLVPLHLDVYKRQEPTP